MTPSFLDFLLAQQEDPTDPLKRLSPNAPGVRRDNAIALPGLVATARGVTQTANALERGDGSFLDRFNSGSPFAPAPNAVTEAASRIHARRALPGETRPGPLEDRARGEEFLQRFNAPSALLPQDDRMQRLADAVTREREHTVTAPRATLAPERRDASDFVHRDTEHGGSVEMFVKNADRAPDRMQAFQGTDEEFGRGTAQYDRALERRSDFLRQSPQMRMAERFAGGVTDAALLGRTHQLQAALDPNRTTADYDLDQAALPEATSGEQVAGMLGGFAGMALPFAAGAKALRVGGAALAPGVTGALGEAGVGGRMLAGAGENVAFGMAHRGATEDPDLLSHLKTDAALGAAFGLMPHGTHPEQTGAVPRDPRAIRFNQRMDEALGATPSAMREAAERVIVSRGTPVVEPPPVTGESLRAHVDAAGPDILPRETRQIPDGAPFRQRSMDETGTAGDGPIAGIRYMGGMAGGVAGTAYGYGQGDTPEERAANAALYGLGGVLGGAGLAEGYSRLAAHAVPDGLGARPASVHTDPRLGAIGDVSEAGEGWSFIGSGSDGSRFFEHPQHGRLVHLPDGTWTPDAERAPVIGQRVDLEAGPHAVREHEYTLTREPRQPDTGNAQDQVLPRRTPTLRGGQPRDPSGRPRGRTRAENYSPYLAPGEPVPPESPLVVGKVPELEAGGVRPDEHRIRWETEKSGEQNLSENLALLDEAMRRGRPIRDASVHPDTRELAYESGVLKVERDRLRAAGWQYDPGTAHWQPPAQGGSGGALRNEVGALGVRRRDLPNALRRMPNGMDAEGIRAFNLGEDAALNGLSRDVNPHEPDSPAWAAFERGWRGVQPRQRGTEVGLRDTPQTGASNIRPLTTIAGAGTGAAIGAAQDDEHPLRGALIGGALGAAGGAALPSMARDLMPGGRAANRVGAFGDPHAFYSRLDRSINEFPQERGTPQQWAAYLAQRTAKGEREWVGIDGFLRDATQRGEPVTREQVRALYDRNAIRLQEVQHGGREPVYAPVQGPDGRWMAKNEATGHVAQEGLASREAAAEVARRLNSEQGLRVNGNPKFSQYTTPGGENYREVLVTLTPRRETGAWDAFQRHLVETYGRRQVQIDDLTPEENAWRLRAASEPGADNAFRSEHWNEPDVLLHLRMTDRTLPNGEKVLFVEEVQSDWHQQGRQKGYGHPEAMTSLPEGYTVSEEPISSHGFYNEWYVRDEHGSTIRTGRGRTREEAIEGALRYINERKRLERVPDAPFKKTDEWMGLGMKRVLDEAAAGGYDRVAWTTGAQQADRFDLSKHIEDLRYIRNGDGTISLEGFKDGESVFAETIPVAKLPDFVGKEVASRIERLEGSAEYHPSGTARTLTGADLRVGGEGMRSFYDRMIPNWLREYSRKLGVKIDVEPVGGSTDEMLASIRRENPEVARVIDRRIAGGESPEAALDWYDRQYFGGTMRNRLGMEGNPSFRVTDELRDRIRQGQPIGAAPGAVVRGLSGASVGAVAGATQGDSLEHRFRNALMGAGIGGAAALSPEILASMRRLTSDNAGTLGPRTPVEFRDGRVVETESFPPEAYVHPDGFVHLNNVPQTTFGMDRLRALFDFGEDLPPDGSVLHTVKPARVDAQGKVVERGVASTGRARMPDADAVVQEAAPVAAGAASEPVPLPEPTPAQQAAQNVTKPRVRIPADTKQRVRVTADTVPTIESAEAELNAALQGNRPRMPDLVGLADGSLSPEDFAARYGIEPTAARSYARAAQSVTDDPGYVSPLDDPAAAHARPERPDMGFQPPEPPGPVDGVPDDSFLPPDGNRKYGSGAGQIGVSATSLQGVANIRRAGLLTNVSGIARDLAQNAVPTETAASMVASPVDRLLSLYSGQRSTAFSVRGTTEAAYKGATTGFADFGRKSIGRPISEASGRAGIEAASRGVEGADRRIMANPYWDAYVRTVGQVRGSVDMPAAVYAYTRSIDEQARVIAMNEGRTGVALRTRIRDLKEAAREFSAGGKRAEALSPEIRALAERMNGTAGDAVAVSTFTNDNVASGFIKDIRNGKTAQKYPTAGAAVDVALPFKQVPGALFGMTVQMSPLGFLKVGRDFTQWVKKVNAGAPAEEIQALQRATAQGMGRASIGTGIIAGGYMLARDGLMTGAIPTPEQRREGALPFSVKIAGKWIPIGELPPVGALMGLGAELHNGSLLSAGMAFSKNVGGLTLLRGTGDVQDLFGMRSRQDAQKGWNSMAGSMVPTIVGQVAQGMDGVQRKPENPLQAIEARIPGLTGNVPAKVDPATGREVRTGPGGIRGAAQRVVDFTRSRPAAQSSDPKVGRRLEELGFEVPALQKQKGETTEQYQQRAKRVGEATDRALNETLFSSGRPSGSPRTHSDRYNPAINARKELNHINPRRLLKDRPEVYGGMTEAEIRQYRTNEILKNLVRQVRTHDSAGLRDQVRRGAAAAVSRRGGRPLP